jgi:hypothetical protein
MEHSCLECKASWSGCSVQGAERLVRHLTDHWTVEVRVTSYRRILELDAYEPQMLPGYFFPPYQTALK